MTSKIADRLTERMSNQERDQSYPDSEPRDAATLMLIDRSGAVPKVLLGRRHHSHKFMPGKFVFPGGRIETLDRAMPALSELHPGTEKKLMQRVAQPSAEFARGLALAAVRETAEETGLLLGEKGDAPPATPGEIWTEFAKANVYPDLGSSAFHRPGHHPAAPAQALRYPLLHRRRVRRGAHHRGRGGAGFRTGRIDLGADRASRPSRHADHHRRGAGGAAGPGRRRHGPRPAGAVLFHAGPAVSRELL